MRGGGVANAKPKYQPDASGAYNNTFFLNNNFGMLFLRIFGSVIKQGHCRSGYFPP